MKYFKILISEKINFILSAKLAIILGLRKVWEWTSNPQEPDFVAGLVLETTNILKDAWKFLFSQKNIEFSIFEHKGLKDKLLEAGTKSVNVICWGKNLGKDINELLKRGHNVQKIIQGNR